MDEAPPNYDSENGLGKSKKSDFPLSMMKRLPIDIGDSMRHTMQRFMDT
jgi:hypothetical protein